MLFLRTLIALFFTSFLLCAVCSAQGGPDNVEPLLGVNALESVGITIDPAARTLKRLPSVPLK